MSLARTSLAFEGTRHAHAAHIHEQAKTITHIKIKMKAPWISESKDYMWVVAFLELFWVCFVFCSAGDQTQGSVHERVIVSP